MPFLSRFLSSAGHSPSLSSQQVAARLLAVQPAIIASYLKRVALAPSNQTKPLNYLSRHLPDLLTEMARLLGNDQTNPQTNPELLRVAPIVSQDDFESGELHNYKLSDLKLDYQTLRHAILDQFAAQPFSPSAQRLFSDIFEAMLAEAIEAFMRNSRGEDLARISAQKHSAQALSTAQSELLQSENEHRWFEEVMNRLPNPLLFVDMAAGRVSFTNLAAEKLLGIAYAGRQPVDVYGTLIEATDEQGRPLSVDQIPSSRTFRGETINGDEMILKTPAGKFHLKVFSEQFPAANGRDASALILLQDITAQKSTQSDLVRTRNDLNEAVEIAQVGFWHLDIATQEITVTQLLLKQFGIEPSTFKGTLAEAMGAMHADDQARVAEAIQLSITNRTPYHIEYRVVHSDGEIHWLEAKGSAIYDAGGQPVRFTGTTIDITERKKSETAVEQAADVARAERAKFEEVLNQALVPIILLEGPEHRIAFANPTYRDTFALQGALDGKKLADLLPDAVAQGFKDLLDHVYTTGETVEGRDALFRRDHPDGSARDMYVDFTYAAKRDAGNEIEGVLAVIVDVTDKVVSRKVLEQSEIELRALADSMPQHVWMANADGALTYFNENWFKYSGTKFEDNVGDKWTAAVHPDDLASTTEYWQHSLQTASIYQNEFRLRAADGAYRWHVARAVPSMTADGSVARWYGTNTDIHEFKTLAEQLESSKNLLQSEQQKFRTIFANASTSMALLRGDDFVYEIANPSYLALFNNRDIIGKPFLVALPELKGQPFVEHAKSVFETGVAYVDREARAYLKRTENSQLEERYFDQSYTRVLDEDGRPYGVLIHARETTDLVFARRALEESAERYRIAVETANMGTWEIQPQTKVVRWSKRTNEIFGLEESDVVPLEKVVERIHLDDRERAMTAIDAALDPSGDGDYAISYRVLDLNNQVRWVSLLGKAFFGETPTGRGATLFTGNILDITDQVLSEANLKEAKDRAERANSAKSQFLANMSHEIRTPLGAIMGFSSLLKDQSLGRVEQESFLSVIERNSTQLLRIIDDILDLSKVEAGMMLIEHIDFSLPELLTDFSSLMGFKAREKGIAFSSRAVTAIPTIINSDPTRLRQILMNVVGNAIKFTDRGHVELRCRYEAGILDFEIEDTGRGISIEQEKNLFQPFTQADTSTTRKYGGTGLGLVLSRSLAEALGGHFLLKQSSIGVGSVFSVQVKVTTAVDVPFVNGLGFETVPVRSIISVGQLAGMKVLLVEDSPDNQALISIFLGRAGARTDIASDGEQGYKMATSNDYDVVLMDVQMPVMDGITAIKRMRRDGFKVPVIALTAHAMKEERIRCLAAGFTDFLSKPVTREDLVNTILRHQIPSI